MIYYGSSTIISKIFFSKDQQIKFNKNRLTKVFYVLYAIIITALCILDMFKFGKFSEYDIILESVSLIFDTIIVTLLFIAITKIKRAI